MTENEFIHAALIWSNNIIDLDNYSEEGLTAVHIDEAGFKNGNYVITFAIIRNRLCVTKIEYAQVREDTQSYALHGFHVGIRKINDDILDFIFRRLYQDLKKDENVVQILTIIAKSVEKNKLREIIEKRINKELQSPRFKRARKKELIKERKLKSKVSKMGIGEARELFLKTEIIFQVVYSMGLKMGIEWQNFNLKCLEYSYGKIYREDTVRAINENVWGINQEKKSDKCLICNRKIDKENITKEHVLPSSVLIGLKGLTVTSCKECNSEYAKHEIHLKWHLGEQLKNIDFEKHMILTKGKKKVNMASVRKSLEKTAKCAKSQIDQEYKETVIEKIQLGYKDESFFRELEDFKPGIDTVNRFSFDSEEETSINYIRKGKITKIYIRMYKVNYAEITMIER